MKARQEPPERRANTKAHRGCGEWADTAAVYHVWRQSGALGFHVYII